MSFRRGWYKSCGGIRKPEDVAPSRDYAYVAHVERTKAMATDPMQHDLDDNGIHQDDCRKCAKYEQRPE